MNNRIALVTGGSGYFGSLLIQKLLERGYICKVFDLVDVEDRPVEVEFLQGDIRDYESILRACQKVDVVFHNIAQVPLAKDKDLFNSVNITGTENLLKAALSSGVNKVIYTSSSAVFGVPKSNPVTELTTPNPGEAYGKAKLEGELLCKKYIESGLDVTIIRPRTILGHGRLGIFQILFEWISEGCNIPVLGKGDNLYQFVHADDLAMACILASNSFGSNIYNCGAEDFGSMRDVLEHLCNFAKTGSKVVSVPFKPTVFAMEITSTLKLSPLGAYHSLMYGRSMYFDTSKVKQELNWHSHYSNNDMFKESYQWYLSNRENLKYLKNASAHRSGVRQGVLSIVKRLL
jgi:nucleoside-diphosphate-sugar epimerase